MAAGMDPETPRSSKQAVFAEMLDQGIAALHLDARQPGVDVPPDLRGRSWLVLNYSYRYNIDDFRFDDRQVFASLSFSGVRFPCRVPWPAVFAISDANSKVVRVWEEDAPLELRAVLLPDSRDTEDQAPAVGVPTTKPSGLRVIDGGASADERATTDGEGGDPTPGSGPRRGHLVRVK